LGMPWDDLSPNNCPLAWGSRPDQIHASLGTPESITQTASQSVQPFWKVHVRVSSGMSGYALPPPHRIAPSHGGSVPPSNTWFLGSTRLSTPNGISIGSAVFASLTTVTDEQTNEPRYSVSNNRPHLRNYKHLHGAQSTTTDSESSVVPRWQH